MTEGSEAAMLVANSMRFGRAMWDNGQLSHQLSKLKNSTYPNEEGHKWNFLLLF